MSTGPRVFRLVSTLTAGTLLCLASALPAQSQQRVLPAATGLIMFQYAGTKPALHTVNPKSLTERAVPKTSAVDEHPSYSPDGTKVAFDRLGAIWVMNANGKHQVRITSKQGSHAWPSWSPDGSQIVYSANEADPSNVDIYVMNADGSDHVRLTTDPAVDYQPTWSTLGEIAFTSYRVAQTAQLFVMGIDGSAQTDLTNNTSYGDSDPDWSPDGSTIVFSDAGRDHPYSVGPDLWTMSATGTDVTPLIHRSEYSDGEAPTWSPNGKQIAYRANNGTGGSQIWVVKADGSGETMVAGSLAENDGDDNPTWQPTGR